MVRLSGERKDQGEALMSIEAATARAADLVEPVAGSVIVPLAEADGRVLAHDVIAPRDLPPFANSAVDGYAVRFADLSAVGSTRLPLSGRVAAGSDAADVAAAGVAVRIFTGAPIPPGADTVFMQEDVAREEGHVVLPPGLSQGGNLRPAGEDVARSDVVLRAGHRLRPQDLALLAALGLAEIVVRRRPLIALFSTGDELAEPGRPLPPAAIYDANRSLLRAMIIRAGAEVRDLGILRDEPAGLSERLMEAAAHCDLIVTSGGVSVGEEDHVKAAVERCGSLDLWRVAIKPGRPVAIGKIGQAPFIGLPGNPVAVFVTFAFIARPLIARLSGAEFVMAPSLPVRLGFAHRKKPGRREYLRVSLEPGADGMMIARKDRQDGAGALASLSRTDGLIALAEDWIAVEEGQVVPFHGYDTLTA